MYRVREYDRSLTLKIGCFVSRNFTDKPSASDTNRGEKVCNFVRTGRVLSKLYSTTRRRRRTS